ncbi:bifunctional diaminohydroxyphosphoribosylaminopyrimidine deaminase/5-amino-6-(5-phosphoribosylamino)uracil reductase RibD [Anaerovorax sp. IOR16]|uniref:bifunctional diaminohydroxyphosphoribosylaminopyrimidine deaminase/5-amino-6-(5-phosphoribosylamino)uracil reductase RibD n=1 Tax=Anaerovorax sp. IOR16 TaxID=2773458 RepID=UPI0019D17801
MNELDYMRRAIQLAKKGIGFVNPNPLVGAVVVKNGEIIGEGWHECFGGLHAERNALSNCKEDPRGADLYVTLEPCCHYGKTPPCTEAILEAGIHRVIIGSRDPNVLVAGKGAKILRENGVSVEEDFLREECDTLNFIFFRYITTGLPYVSIKYAMTLDGKIATKTGESKWITGEMARAHVQRLRHQYRAIMVGIQTVLEDNPLLTCRMENGRNPIRIVCDSYLRLPLDCQLVNTIDEAPVVVAHCCEDEDRQKELKDKGVRLIKTPCNQGKVDLHFLFKRLAEENIDSILIEGGATLNGSVLDEHLAQRVLVYVAPKIFGGRQAKTPVAGNGVAAPSESSKLVCVKNEWIEQDLFLEYEVEEN